MKKLILRHIVNTLVVLLALGYFFLFARYLADRAITEWQKENYLSQHGILVDASIIDRIPQIHDLAVKYRFVAVDSAGHRHTVEHWEDVTYFEYQYLEHAQSVSIRYDPSDFSISRIEGSFNYLVYGVFAVILIGGSICVLVEYIKYMFRGQKKGEMPS